MRIFVTGGDGFIGRHLVSRLEKTHIVEIYDLSLGDDIRDRARLDRAIEMFQPDAIVHLAALAGVRRGEAYPDEYYTTNVIGTENVFAMAKKHGVKKVVSFSSSSAIDPISLYGRTKLIGENIAGIYSRWIQSIAVVRPFTVYGENGRPDQVIGKWIRQAQKGEPLTFFGDGKSYRPYTYVGELCDAVEGMLVARFVFEVFNICGAEKITLDELANAFANSYGVGLVLNRLPMPESDSMGHMPKDLSNWRLIGYKPKVKFKEQLFRILFKELR